MNWANPVQAIFKDVCSYMKSWAHCMAQECVHWNMWYWNICVSWECVRKCSIGTFVCQKSLFVYAVFGPLCVKRVCSYTRYWDLCVSEECVRICGVGIIVYQKMYFWISCVLFESCDVYSVWIPCVLFESYNWISGFCIVFLINYIRICDYAIF